MFSFHTPTTNLHADVRVVLRDRDVVQTKQVRGKEGPGYLPSPEQSSWRSFTSSDWYAGGDTLARLDHDV